MTGVGVGGGVGPGEESGAGFGSGLPIDGGVDGGVSWTGIPGDAINPGAGHAMPDITSNTKTATASVRRNALPRRQNKRLGR